MRNVRAKWIYKYRVGIVIYQKKWNDFFKIAYIPSCVYLCGSLECV